MYVLPVEHLSYFVKAAQRQQHQDGFGFLVNLRRAQMFCPALQHIGALGGVQAHLEIKHDSDKQNMTNTDFARGPPKAFLCNRPTFSNHSLRKDFILDSSISLRGKTN